jgi:hypothetical protein
LQGKHPEVAIRNYGTGGYGTYQSLLVLERLFANPRSSRPEWVLYRFIEHHEIRYVAGPQWTRLLASTSSRGRVNLPCCFAGDNHPNAKQNRIWAGRSDPLIAVNANGAPLRR